MREALQHHQINEQVLLGDFNLHHPLWGGLNREVTDFESEDLIDIIEDFALHNTLLPGAVTYEQGRAQSTIDLCFVTAGLINRIVSRDDQAEGNLHSAHAERLGQLYLGRPVTKNVSCVTHTDTHSLLGRQGYGTQRLLAPVAKSISTCASAQVLEISAFKAPCTNYATSIQAVEGTAGKLCDRDYLTWQASMWRYPFPTLNCIYIMKADFCEAVGEVKT